MENIWNSQSVLSAHEDLFDLVLVRWNKYEEWSPWNCILLTEEEASAHTKLENVTEVVMHFFTFAVCCIFVCLFSTRKVTHRQRTCKLDLGMEAIVRVRRHFVYSRFSRFGIIIAIVFIVFVNVIIMVIIIDDNPLSSLKS